MKDKRYMEIVEKLGFEPKDYIPQLLHTENDNFENPFDVLSYDELMYLQQNNYFKESVSQ